jgi:hypothetical protein
VCPEGGQVLLVLAVQGVHVCFVLLVDSLQRCLRLLPLLPHLLKALPQRRQLLLPAVLVGFQRSQGRVAVIQPCHQPATFHNLFYLVQPDVRLSTSW